MEQITTNNEAASQNFSALPAHLSKYSSATEQSAPPTLESLCMVTEMARGIAILIDGDSKHIASNQGGADLLARQRGLALDRGQVIPTVEGQRAVFRRTIGAALVDTRDSLLLTRGHGRSPLFIEFELWHTGSTREAHPAAYVAMHVIDVEAPVHLTWERLAMLFDLTGRECEVANRLVQGEQVPEIGEQLQIARETVRSHIKRIFDKTGTHRQSQLVRLLMLAAR